MTPDLAAAVPLDGAATPTSAGNPPAALVGTNTTLRILSLGAGVQSTTLLILAATGKLDRLDCAIFADTGWEPRAVYDHLDRIEREVAAPAGIPIYRVSVGNIRDDALDPEHRFASMPLYVLNADGTDGMARRQCTSEYKIKPIKAKVRDLLGYPHPTPVPANVSAEQWVGISRDEFHRARDADVRYMRNRFPLLELDMTRADCQRLLRRHGYGATPKSACVGCPFHGNRQWRQLRDEAPAEWADAVAFDAAIRNGSAGANAQNEDLRGAMFLHRSRVPLDQAPIDRVTSTEWRQRQGDIFIAAADVEEEAEGCSPWACRGGDAA